MVRGFLAASAAVLALPAGAGTRRRWSRPTPTSREAGYEDSLATARRLGEAVDALIATPSAEALQAARAAWLAARVPYQQTEAFRFGNVIVDEWEGKVNAWPLDEGLIDYVDASYGGATDENPYADAQRHRQPELHASAGEVDAAEITPALLERHAAGGRRDRGNVATGYHAVEFLLWGQDLNGTEAGAGNRPWTDYAEGDACTDGNCDRRAAYLKAATDLLISDLEWMAGSGPRAARGAHAVTGDPDAGVVAILTGMGSLSYGEQAGERMRLGLMLHDPEEEHDCFSDNTYNSHYYDGMGCGTSTSAATSASTAASSRAVGVRAGRRGEPRDRRRPAGRARPHADGARRDQDGR